MMLLQLLSEGGEKFSAATFVADGAEIQLNDKRFEQKLVITVN